MPTPKSPRKRTQTYCRVERAKWLYDGSTSLPEMAAALRRKADELDAMAKTGKITLLGKVQNDYAYLETKDPEVASGMGFEDER